MNKKNIIILIISIIILVGALGFFLYLRHVQKNPNEVDTPSQSEVQKPDFYFFDEENNQYDLSNFSGKPSIILFWKADNTKSFEMISLLEKYYDDYKDNVNIFAVNVDKSSAESGIVEDVKAVQFKIPMYFDFDLVSAKKYNLSSYPSAVILDEEGNLIKNFDSTLTEDQLLANLELL